MGRLRSALRAYALDYDDPAEVLHRLDRELCYFESDISATVVYAVTAPPFDLVTICNAGHPAPLMAQPGRAFAEVAEVSAGLLLGLEPELRRHSEQVPLPPGAALAFYTDGLVERRRRSDQPTDPDVERLDIVRRAFLLLAGSGAHHESAARDDDHLRAPCAVGKDASGGRRIRGGRGPGEQPAGDQPCPAPRHLTPPRLLAPG